MTYKFIDLFAGLGGFHIALSHLGHQCVLACEVDARLREIYAANFGMRPHEDIRKLRGDLVPDHDILCAGFPCQPFSKAGEQLGTECARDGDLFGHLVRIIKYKKPKFLLLENVPNLERHNCGATYEKMRNALERLGYTVDQKILSPHQFGIPQVRPRLFIVASRKGLNHFLWPSPTPTITSIFSILDKNPKDAVSLSVNHARCLSVWQEFLDRLPGHVELPSFPIWSAEFGANYDYKEPPATQTSQKLARRLGAFGQALRDYSPIERLDGIPPYARGVTVFPRWKQRFIQQNRDFYESNKRYLRGWIRKIQNFSASFQKFEWNCKGEKRILSEHIVQFRASGVRVKRATAAPTLIAMTASQEAALSPRGQGLEEPGAVVRVLPVLKRGMALLADGRLAA